MEQFQSRRARLPELDMRTVVFSAGLLALLALVLSAYLVNEFREQRQVATQNDLLLEAWQAQLLTATPASAERARLDFQLAAVQDRFAEASALLPGTEIEVAILSRIVNAAEASGVELTTLNEAGGPVQEGSLVGWQYDLAAAGALNDVTEFARRLEEEAFPSAFLSDPLLNQIDDDQYQLAAMLTVYGSTLSTGSFAAPTAVTGEALVASLLAQAEAALERGDYELALSLLLRLRAVSPEDRTVDRQLYDAYLLYGDALLLEGLPTLAYDQYQAALAIDANGDEALSRLIALAPQLTPSPTAGAIVVVPPGGGPATAIVVTATPDPAATAEATPSRPPTSTPAPPPPTLTPRPTRTLPPTVAPPPTSRPAPPTSPPEPTSTSGPSPTPTLSPTPTGTATPVVTPNPFPFGALAPFYLPNCGLTQIKGTVRDATTNQPLNGITVRVWWDGAPPGTVYSLPTGQDPSRGPGEWDVVLANFPKAGQWYVAVVDRTTGALLSEREVVFTDTNSCEPGGSGHQVVLQDFVRWGTGPGVPGATLTPSRTPTRTAVPSTTPTVTRTPTVTATPTVTPVSVIDPVNPDEPIPDFPAGPLVRQVNVAENVTLRFVRVFINLSHEDVGDLQLTLVHPDGTRVIFHQQGQDAGGDEIRRWFTLTSLAGRQTPGAWRLEVLDTIEGRIGTLVSWTLELQP